jgi:hypothetical protein
MGMSVVVLGPVHVEAAGGSHGPEPERDEHHADSKLGPGLGAARDGDAAPGQHSPDDEHDERVTDTPPKPEQGGASRSRRPADERRDGDHVIHLQSM